MKHNSISEISTSFPILICTKTFLHLFGKAKRTKNKSNLLAQWKGCSMNKNQTPYLKSIEKKNLLVFHDDRNFLQ